ncbi:hypothetical protein Gotur_026721 [Gossypium turneri]
MHVEERERVDLLESVRRRYRVESSVVASR